MARLAYVNDHRYYKIEGRVYSSGSMTSAVWDRFLSSFESVTVFSCVTESSQDLVNNLNEVTREGVNFINVGYVDDVKRLAVNFFKDDEVLAAELRKYDAVVVRVPGQLAFNAARICLRNGILLGAEVVGCPFDAYWNYGNIQGKILAPLMYFVMRSRVKNIGHLVYVTEYFLQRRYPSKGEQINASNVDIETPLSDVLENRLSRVNSSPEMVLGLMGSMNVRYKGHEVLLKAVARVKNKMPPFRIEFVGPGDFDWVRKIALDLDLSEHVLFKGKLKSGQTVMNWLDSLHVYIHPSKQEGLPRSVIEAMSRGCPVLASSVAGTPELLNKLYLHRPGDIEGLAAQLEKIILNPKEIEAMAVTNFEKARRYSRSFLSQKRNDFWKKFYLELAESQFRS